MSMSSFIDTPKSPSVRNTDGLLGVSLLSKNGSIPSKIKVNLFFIIGEEESK